MKLYYQMITFFTVLGALGYSECMFSNEIAAHSQKSAVGGVNQLHNSQAMIAAHAQGHASVHEQEEEAEIHHHHEKKEDNLEFIESDLDLYGLLKYAVQHDNDVTVQNFIDRGVDVDMQDPVTGESLLHLAVASNARKVALLLLHEHANVTVKDDQGDTPLDCATRDKNQYMIQLLSNASAKQLTNQDTPVSGFDMNDTVVQPKSIQSIFFNNVVGQTAS